MSGKRNYFTETKLYRWFSAMGEIKYGERLGHFVTFLKTNRTLILYIYNLFIYLFIFYILDKGKKLEAAFQRASWHKSCS